MRSRVNCNDSDGNASAQIDSCLDHAREHVKDRRSNDIIMAANILIVWRVTALHEMKFDSCNTSANSSLSVKPIFLP